MGAVERDDVSGRSIMKARTLVFIICSPAGRVGKSMVARLLGDYFLATNRSFFGFDTDPHEPVLAARFPQQVIVSDLTTVPGQMALVDPLLVNDEIPKIIDLWHRSMEGFFTLVDQTDFIAEAVNAGIEPVFFFIADASTRSLDAATRLAARYPEQQMIVVENAGAAPLSRDQLARYPAHRIFKVGALDPVLRNAIEDPGFSLSRFMLAPPSNMSIVVRSGVRDWLARIFSQLRSFELRLALEQAEHLG
ncbi:hypothetical protein MHY1_02803 [Methylovirgula sp. HY1]|nr:hypothetical protein MHY1_02803 [Methylovirgula sp. HY1]